MNLNRHEQETSHLRLLVGSMHRVRFASAFTQQSHDRTNDDQSPKQDMKDAGHDSKNAAKSAGEGTKKGTQKAYNSTKHGTKKAYHSSKNGTKRRGTKPRTPPRVQWTAARKGRKKPAPPQ